MNLLEATATLIDCAKTYGPERDAVLRASVKRMEKRLAVLQLRAAKSLRRRRQKGWKDVQLLAPSCEFCGAVFLFGDFIKKAELNGRGDVIRFDCPECDMLALLLLTDGKAQTYYTGKEFKERTQRMAETESMKEVLSWVGMSQ